MWNGSLVTLYNRILSSESKIYLISGVYGSCMHEVDFVIHDNEVIWERSGFEQKGVLVSTLNDLEDEILLNQPSGSNKGTLQVIFDDGTYNHFDIEYQ